MKFVVFTLLVVAIAVHAAPKDNDSNDEKILKECLAENDIKEAELEELLKNEDPKVYCFAACVYEKEGILKNGELSEEALVKSILKEIPKMKEETLYKIIDLCKGKVKDVTDVCDLTNTLTSCLEDLLDIEEA